MLSGVDGCPCPGADSVSEWHFRMALRHAIPECHWWSRTFHDRGVVQEAQTDDGLGLDLAAQAPAAIGPPRLCGDMPAALEHLVHALERAQAADAHLAG